MVSAPLVHLYDGYEPGQGIVIGMDLSLTLSNLSIARRLDILVGKCISSPN